MALGGADTATRTQTVWQVRVDARAGRGLRHGCRRGAVGRAPDDRRRSRRRRLTTPASCRRIAGYRGLENRLYRVEIHDAGALGAARFKWSRDNGSIVSVVRGLAVAGGQTTLTVNRIGRDRCMRFRIDDWVTVTDDHRELMGEPGEMARVVDIDETRNADRPRPGAADAGTARLRRHCRPTSSPATRASSAGTRPPPPTSSTATG